MNGLEQLKIVVLTNILSIGKSKAILSPFVTDVLALPVVSLYEAWGGDKKLTEDIGDAIDAKRSVEVFFEQYKIQKALRTDICQITVTLEVPLAGNGAKITMTAVANVEAGANSDDIQTDYLSLYDQINSAYGKIASKRGRGGNAAPAVPLTTDKNGDPVGASEEKPAPKMEREVVEAEGLAVETKDGKRYFKLKGGKYTKFGVRVWPEVLEQAGINTKTVMPTPLSGEMVVEVDPVTKKPVRVASLKLRDE